MKLVGLFAVVLAGLNYVMTEVREMFVFRTAQLVERAAK
jgi:hypothetical protein